MGFDTLKERKQLEKEIEKEQKAMRIRESHDAYLANDLFPSLYKKFSKAPIDEKLVVFASSKKDELPDSMQSLYKALTEKGYRCMFFGKKASFKSKSDEVKYYKEFFTLFGICKTLFIDDVFDPVYCITPRDGQRIVQLWHTPAFIRKTGYAVGKRGVAGEITDRKLVHTNYTDIAASSSHVKDIVASVFNSSESIVHAWGCPKTDIYFDKDFIKGARNSVIKSVPNLLGSIGNRKIILYAPTYRGTGSDNAYALRTLDLILLRRYLGDKFVFLIKLHPFLKDESYFTDEVKELISDFAFEVPHGVKTESLLCAADVMITDYSTLVFDYSLLERPMVFYAFDFKRYTRHKPLFYDYERFVPGPIVYDSGELAQAVLNIADNFDPEKTVHFKKKYMGGCDGRSTDRVIHYAVKK